MPLVAANRQTTIASAQAQLTRYAGFNTVPHYDLGNGYQAGPPNGLVDDDVRRTWWLRSRISAKQRPDWLDADGTAGQLWAALPANAALDDANGATYAANRQAAFDLFTHFYGPARRIARVSKVLHPKRSEFFAVLDSHVMGLYRPMIANRPRNPLDQVPLAWDAMRVDLLLPVNRQALAALRKWLQAQVPSDPRFAAFLQLSNVRLFDIVACW